MHIKKVITLTLILISGIVHLFGQTGEDSLFGSQVPLKIGLSISLKEVRESKKDTFYISQKLYYQNDSGKFDSVMVGLKGRGNFRLKECYFPPLWIKIKKTATKRTVFEGNKKVKLVLPCDNRESSNKLILKEFLCYRLYEKITPFAFHTRLVDINLTELGKNKNKTSKLKGIFIEDVDKTAKRIHAKPLKTVKISPAAFNDTCAARFELFQYMISNTDWSVVHQHNSKLFVQGLNKYISIPYDFDMSGLVDAPYAVVSEINGEKLDVDRVTDRIYRGYCHSPGVMQFVRKEFLSKKEILLAVPDQLNGALPDKEIKNIKKYLEEFFNIIKDDRLFQYNILEKCRVK